MKEGNLKLIILYQILWLLVLSILWSFELRGILPEWFIPFSLPYQCALIGALGGVIYCLRAVYLNRSVKGKWNDDWNVWYYLRPLVSLIVGSLAYIFLKAGLLVLDSGPKNEGSPYGFLALSFIAGLNVDRFLVKLEELAHTLWGIKPSRTSENSLNSKKE